MTTYSEADTAQPILHTAKPILQLTADLTRSLRRPTSRTLTLIEKALAWLRPFESPSAYVSSKAERHDLLTLLRTHQLILSPYLDTDRIEFHLRQPSR